MRIAPLAVIVAAISSVAFAHQGVKDAQVRARMKQMEIIADHTRVLGSMAKGQSRFDKRTANDTLTSISANAKDIPKQFQVPADDPISEARPEIWDNWDRFHDMSLALARASTGPVEDLGDLRSVLAEIATACRACHEAFRD